MRHRAAGEINERHGAGERVIQKECGLVSVEFVRQNAARLQIRDLAGGKRDQFAYPFVESGHGAEPQQIRNLRTRIRFEIIAMPELMMRSEKPPRIRLDALQ